MASTEAQDCCGSAARSSRLRISSTSKPRSRAWRMKSRRRRCASLWRRCRPSVRGYGRPDAGRNFAPARLRGSRCQRKDRLSDGCEVPPRLRSQHRPRRRSRPPVGRRRDPCHRPKHPRRRTRHHCVVTSHGLYAGSPGHACRRHAAPAELRGTTFGVFNLAGGARPYWRPASLLVHCEIRLGRRAHFWQALASQPQRFSVSS